MAEVTRKINTIYSKFIVNQLTEKEAKRRTDNSFQKLTKAMEDKLNEKPWTRIANKALYYIAEDRLLMADVQRWLLFSDDYRLDMDGVNGGRMLNIREVQRYFYNGKANNPFIKDNKISALAVPFYLLEELFEGNSDVMQHITAAPDTNEYWEQFYKYASNLAMENMAEYRLKEARYHYIFFIDDEMCHRYYLSNASWSVSSADESDNFIVKIPVSDAAKAYPTHLETLLALDFNLFEEDDTLTKAYQELKALYDANMIQIKGEEKSFGEIEYVPAYYEKVLSNQVAQLDGVSMKIEDIRNGIQLDEEGRKVLFDDLLKCDTRRIDLEKYSDTILKDPNGGLWDIWETPSDTKESVKIDTDIYARNPVTDVIKDGVIGIDFGTKSTVVTCKKGRAGVSLMRIGSGKFKRDLTKNSYENPTVMEFRSIDSFLKCYNEREGRPETLWEDVLVSHQAANDMQACNNDGSTSETYSAFFSELKQWTGDKDRIITIKDSKDGTEKTLKPFIENGDDFNPIEIYAYYLGLFINTMYNGIFVRYKLSFPVTYEIAIREKILVSFKKGLKKSLPQSVLADTEIMNIFEVEQGASEPAAYAMCALQEYGFEPEDDEKVFYGIFDFGGGTTDFDFGIWQTEEENTRRYDYMITHFGASGDKYLGGENLLDYMAYEVVKENRKELIEKDMVFSMPHGCDPFVESELLLNNASQEARLNTKIIAEALRGYWQEEKEVKDKIVSGKKITVSLVSKNGELQANISLTKTSHTKKVC